MPCINQEKALHLSLQHPYSVTTNQYSIKERMWWNYFCELNLTGMDSKSYYRLKMY